MQQNNRLSNIRALEAILFIYGEPVQIKKLSELLKITAEEISELKEELITNLKDRGLSLIENEGALQLTTHPDFGNLIELIVKEELSKELSPASLETLSIVAYTGPISRSRIDYIRGVNSSYILRNLLIRGLVDRKLDPKRLNTYLYNVSFDFMRHLGVRKIDELPEFFTYRNLVLHAEKNLESSLSSGSDEVLQDINPIEETNEIKEEQNI